MLGLRKQESSNLSERHPRKQGLKLWSYSGNTRWRLTFRATSTKTRIETTLQLYGDQILGGFQSDIHENKD